MAGLQHLSLLLAVWLLTIHGARGLQCYNCSDTGDGGCSPRKARVMQCPFTADVCVHTFTTVNISFTSLSVLVKGCGSENSSVSPFTSQNEAIGTVTEFATCGANLCNTQQFNASQVPWANNTHDASPLNTSVECYGCIGTSPDKCSDSQASKMTCAGKACAEGFLDIQLRNQGFLTVFFKDCGRWGRFHQISLQGPVGLGVTFRRITCEDGDLCNREQLTTTLPPHTTPRGGSAALLSSPLLLVLLVVGVLA